MTGPLSENLMRVPDGPLYGTLVVAFDQQIAGSLASDELAKEGATVVKIEKSETGDPKRTNSSPTAFNTFNAGKYSVSFASSPEDMELKAKLLKEADVIIDNRSEEAQLRDQILQRRLKEPAGKPLIYCAINGFGRGAKIPVYDRVLQAASGMADLNQGLVPFPIIDMAAGKEAAKDIVSHLFWINRLSERERSRLRPIRLDISMMDVAMGMMGNVAARYYDEKKTESSLVPFGLFDTSNGKIAIATAKDDQYARLCEVLNMPQAFRHHATNLQRQEHQKEIEAEMQRILSQQPNDHWIEALEKANIPVQPVKSFADAFHQYGLPLMQVDIASGVYVGKPTHSSVFPTNPRIGGAPALNADRDFVADLVQELAKGQPLDRLLRKSHRNESANPRSGFYSKFKWVDLQDINWSQDRCALPWARGRMFQVTKTAPVYAEKAEEGSVLKTAAKDQAEITVNVAGRDALKVTTAQGDEYFLNEKKFADFYLSPPDEQGRYWPKLYPPRQALMVTENIRFQAPWGKVQYIPKGGWLVRISDTDIYGVHPDNTVNFTCQKQPSLEKGAFSRAQRCGRQSLPGPSREESLEKDRN